MLEKKLESEKTREDHIAERSIAVDPKKAGETKRSMPKTRLTMAAS